MGCLGLAMHEWLKWQSLEYKKATTKLKQTRFEEIASIQCCSLL